MKFIILLTSILVVIATQAQKRTIPEGEPDAIDSYDEKTGIQQWATPGNDPGYQLWKKNRESYLTTLFTTWLIPIPTATFPPTFASGAKQPPFSSSCLPGGFFLNTLAFTALTASEVFLKPASSQ